MMSWFMSRCQNKVISNNVIFAIKMSLLSERHLMTVVKNVHKPYFIFKTYVMSWLKRCHVSLMHTPSSKVLPLFATLFATRPISDNRCL